MSTIKILSAAALTLGLGVSAASAATVNDLIMPKSLYDQSATTQAALQANLDTLGVSTRPGDIITAQEQAAIQKIIRDEGNFSSKARRVDLVVNGESAGYGNGFNAR